MTRGGIVGITTELLMINDKYDYDYYDYYKYNKV